MIRAVFSDPAGQGPKTVLFGIDRRNISRLEGGDPILVDLAQLGVPGVVVVIAFGETLQALAAELRARGFALPTLPKGI